MPSTGKLRRSRSSLPIFDRVTQNQLARGSRLVEALKQDQYEPQGVEKQILIIFAVTKGYADDYPVSAVRKYERELSSFMESKHPEYLAEIREKKVVSDELEDKLVAALDELKKPVGRACLTQWRERIMPSLKQITTKIKSVRSTRRIMGAMKLIAAVRLQKAQAALMAYRPYSDAYRDVVLNVAALSESEDHPLLRVPEEKANLHVLFFTSDRGLCGSFNSALIRNMQSYVGSRAGFSGT